MDRMDVDVWRTVWLDVGRRVAAHRLAGRRHLLTEDAVRMCTVLALEEVGVDPSDLAIEVLEPALGGGKLDLVVTTKAGPAVVELKYPRGSRSGVSPDTMTLGELLRDFLRVALVPASDRWVVVVLEPELRRYLSRRGSSLWTDEPEGTLVLERAVLEALPKTARDAIGSMEWLLPVRATCVVAAPVDVDLALFAYRIEAPAAGCIPAALVFADPVPATSVPAATAPTVRPKAARAQILTAIGALARRSGQPEVTVQEVVDEMRRAGSTYAESTVRTMLTSHMCAQVHGPNIATYDDVDRTGRGTYRLRSTDS